MEEAQLVVQPAEASKIFVFDEVYQFRAAQEQAEKKKLSAFGMMAKLFNRPKDETVQLSRQEMRLEPFWHIVGQRSVDYTCQLTYQVPVHNPHAQALQFEGNTFEVARQKDKARIEFVAVEQCHRKIGFERFIDGMQRDIKSSVLQNYVSKYKFAEQAAVDRPEMLKPLLSMAAAKQIANAELNVAIAASEISADRIEFTRTYMYLRPVFAFEYRWASADKIGVIEVDGLTGEIVENGRWFKDKIDRIVTREMLVDLGAEVAGSFIPGGGVAIKLIGKMTEPGAPGHQP